MWFCWASRMNTPILEKLLVPANIFGGAAQNCGASLGDPELVLQPLDETESSPVGSLFPTLSPNGHRVGKSLHVAQKILVVAGCRSRPRQEVGPQTSPS